MSRETTSQGAAVINTLLCGIYIILLCIAVSNSTVWFSFSSTLVRDRSVNTDEHDDIVLNTTVFDFTWNHLHHQVLFNLANNGLSVRRATVAVAAIRSNATQRRPKCGF